MEKLKISCKLLIMAIMLFAFVNSNSQSNQYLHFDRANDYVRLDNGSQYITGTTGLTMTGWFYFDTQEMYQGMMGFRGASEGFYLITLDNGQIECRLETTTGLHEYVAPNNTALPEVWQHYAWVYDGTSIKLYLNGILKGSATASGTLTNTTIPFTIGRSIIGTLNFYFGGRADEVSVWNVALDQTAIQDIMNNELVGNEAGLQLYYKCNQGDPGGDNTTITKLICELGAGIKDADLMEFAMVGETSNFNGVLNTGYQAISFPSIPNKLISDAPFDISASATSGLPVEFSIQSGPATVVGSTITLTGTEGVVVVAANQPGDGTYEPAVEVINSFNVINPANNLPIVDMRHPLEGDVYLSELSHFLVSAKVDIDYSDLFSVDNLVFSLDGVEVTATNHGDGYFTAWIQPLAYGNATLQAIATNNYGFSGTTEIDVNLINAASNTSSTAFSGVWVSVSEASVNVTGQLPSFLGSFNNITATLNVTCPSGGCGEWDRKASIEAKTHDGRWIEIIRYITPYGVACSHSTDLTDYESILKGKVEFRVSSETFDNGYNYELVLNYSAGTPTYLYSNVDPVWNETYNFGDYANLQPVEDISWNFSSLAADAKLKIMNTGHGWGDLNSNNAAEFYEANHKIVIDGDENNQHLWAVCNPNPDGCQPQSGTWYYNRAGWCPGSISNVYDYSLSSYLGSNPVILQYIFDEGYIDLCHPNHPDCVTGVTCTDCEDGYNPHYIIGSNLITYYNSASGITGLMEEKQDIYGISIYPNPSEGLFNLESIESKISENLEVSVYNSLGSLIEKFLWNGTSTIIDLREMPQGVYYVQIGSGEEVFAKRLIKL